jgi:ABC-type transport system involved in multi-copper enzyme maturation permease subunit
MVNVYLKNLRKSWIGGILPPLFLVGFVGLIAMSWSSMQDFILERLEQMNNPIYQAILGDLGLEGFGLTFQGALFMYGGGTLNIRILFLSLVIPARLLSTEIDKKTIDMMLSFPIPRWRYLLEKFSVYLTYNLLFPILFIAVLIGSTLAINEEIDLGLLTNVAIGYYLLLFALGALSLLCATIFLDSNKSLSAAGVVILSQYFLVSMGGFIPALEDFQGASLFHYFKIGAIQEAGMLPLTDVFIVVGVGLIALVSALVIFQKREFAL